VSVITAVKDNKSVCREKTKTIPTLANSENIPIDKNSGRFQIGKKILVNNLKSNLVTKKRPIEESLVLKPSKRIKTVAQKPEVDSPSNVPKYEEDSHILITSFFLFEYSQRKKRILSFQKNNSFLSKRMKILKVILFLVLLSGVEEE
jgi:hypothetical protein